MRLTSNLSGRRRGKGDAASASPPARARRSRPRPTPEGPEAPSEPPRSSCSASVPWARGLDAGAAFLVRRGDDKVVGPRFARLLVAIDRHGSLRQAARALGVGYRHAIAWVQEAESALGLPLVSRTIGGASGGGAALTDEGRRLVVVYFDTVREIQDVLRRAESRFLGDG